MPVSFNTAANTVIPESGVAQFYRGKALRAGIEAQEIENAQAPDKLEIAKQQLEVNKGGLEVERGNLLLRAQESLDKAGEKKREALFGYAAGYSSYLEENPDDVEGADQAGALIYDSYMGEGAHTKEAGGQPVPPDAVGALIAADLESFRKAKEQAQKDAASMERSKSTNENRLEVQRMKNQAAAERAAAASASGGSDRDKKIKQYQSVLGLSEEEAIIQADNLNPIKINTVTGAIQVVDELGETVREIQVERDDVPTPAPKPGHTLWDLAEYATGPINTVAAAVAIPLAWVGVTPAEKVISARQTFATTNQSFIRALAVNKRYPVGEMERIREEISLLPSFLDDPKLMKTRMVALRTDLGLRQKQAENDAADPNQTPEYRAGAKVAASDIKNYLALLGGKTAPQSAIDALKTNPEKYTIEAFEEFYGYRPEGFD